MPKVTVDYDICRKEIDKLISLEKQLGSLPPKYRKLVAEIVILRLSYLLENAITSIAVKIQCGAKYADGSLPVVMVGATNKQAALNNMIHHGRAKPRYNLKWSQVSEIKKNLKHVLNLSDNFVMVLDHHGSFIEELRRVRNRIAHNNRQSRKKYREVVKHHYGAFLNAATPGVLLLSPKNSPPLIAQYLLKSRILVKQAIRA
jgi:hypothetical protein